MMKKGVFRAFAAMVCAVYCIMVLAGTGFAEGQALSAQPSDNIQQTDLYLVLDNSKSMKDTDPDQLLTGFAEAFYIAAPTGPSTVGVVTYSGKVETVTQPKRTDDQSGLGDLNYTQDGHKTDIGAALNRAADELLGSFGTSGENPYKAIVLVTDGDPNELSSEYVAKSANGRVIPVYCIYVNDGQNKKQDKCRDYLKNIADETGTNQVYEVNSAEDIDQVVGEIVADIYNYNPSTEELEIDGEVDKTITVGDNVYEMICNIKYTNGLTLGISSPSGKQIYDGGTSYSPMLHVTNDHSPAVVNLLWPEVGDYTFHLSVEEAQTLTFSLVEISAGVNLTLSDSRIQKGKTLQASCPLMGNSNATVTNSMLRIYDSADMEVMESESSDAIVPNSQGGFDIDTAGLDTGNYNVVAISTLDNGDMLASVKVPFEVIDKPFPWHIVIIAGVILLLILAVLIALRIRANSSGMVRPERCQIRTKVLSRGGGRWEQICFVDLPMPQVMPDGKPRDLYSLVKHELELRSVDTSLLPRELEDMKISYWVKKRSRPTEGGYFLIEIGSGKEAERTTFTKNSSAFSYTFGDSVMVDLKYSN